METNEQITRVWMLLEIMAKANGYPKLKTIHDTAEAELVKRAAELGKVPSDDELVRTAATTPTSRVYPRDSGVTETAPATEVRRLGDEPDA